MMKKRTGMNESIGNSKLNGRLQLSPTTRAMMLYDYNTGLPVLGRVSWRGGDGGQRKRATPRLFGSLTHRPSYRSIVRVPASSSACLVQGHIHMVQSVVVILSQAV